VKTGRLLKFQRKEAEVHAYLYQDGANFKAAIYVRPKQKPAQTKAEQELVGRTSQLVEDEVRAWIDARYPR
jgi:hypothetical protein